MPRVLVETTKTDASDIISHHSYISPSTARVLNPEKSLLDRKALQVRSDEVRLDTTLESVQVDSYILADCD